MKLKPPSGSKKNKPNLSRRSLWRSRIQIQSKPINSGWPVESCMLPEADPLFKKALEGRRQKLDEEHPDTLESKNDLAVLYKEQVRYEEAEPPLLYDWYKYAHKKGRAK